MVFVFERLRYYIFLLVQLLSGRKILNHLNDISFILGNRDPDSIQSRKRTLLKYLLSHAIYTVPYYKKLAKEAVLKDFPVIDKSIIRGSFDSFRSSSYSEKKLITMITSGSTGTPFKTYQDKNKKRRNYADTIYFARLAGFKFGNRLIYLKIWAKGKMKRPIHYKLQNIVPIDAIKLDDEQIKKLIGKMEKIRSTYGIIGYASALEQVGKYLDKNQILIVNAKVQSIIAISESLNDFTRETLGKAFGVIPVSRYSNIENGIIAQEILNDSMRFLLNTASYVIEILKLDCDEAVKPGELGRIVVTDLFNYGMPLIRYDTGDIGVMEKETNADANQYMTMIEGRKMDLIYNIDGELISSFIVYKNMWKYPEIIQYQLIQVTKKEYLFKININGPFKRETELIKEFKIYLGSDAQFVVEYVNEIPLLDSGKRKKIVNLYTN
jgi:phenylacetate-CoA ligase